MPEISSDASLELQNRKDQKKRKIDKWLKRATQKKVNEKARELGHLIDETDYSMDEKVKEDMHEQIRDTERFYALPIMLKPGKQQYLIKYKDTSKTNYKTNKQHKAKRRQEKNKIAGYERFSQDKINEDLQPDIYFYQTNVIRREEEVPPFAKEALSTKVVRNFANHGGTIFTKWIKDDESKFDEMAETDFIYWKVTARMVKDDDDREECRRLIKE